jgi:hypothetical protein
MTTTATMRRDGDNDAGDDDIDDYNDDDTSRR